MSKTSHIHRRGNTLYFRLAIPDRFQKILKVTQFNQSLHTQNIKDATPAAYRLAAEAKTLFLYLDKAMNDFNTLDDDLLRLAVEELEVEDTKKSLKLLARQRSTKSQSQLVKLRVKSDSLEDELQVQHLKHKKELEVIALKVKAEAYDKLASFTISGAPAIQQAPIVEKFEDSKAPLLSVAYKEFLKGHPTNQSKLKTFENLFIGFAGDKKIDQLTQVGVNEFFFLLVKCGGGRGGKTNAYNALNIHERVAHAEKNGDELIGLGTFKNTYKGAATQFFDWLNLKYADVAPVLTTSHIDYKKFGGLRAKGECKQRALKIAEIERLMSGFVINKKNEHQYWLMMIGLFTGGRVNEICQLNPQHDIILDTVSDVWHFNLTDEAAGADVKKSHKNDGSKRRIPIHSKLIEYGFADYLARVKAAGHDRIFDKFRPKAGKASYYAEEFFRNHLKKVHLHDDKTIGRMVLGMHSVRGSFMSHLVNCLIKGGGLTKKQAMSKIQPLVGHADGLNDENGSDLSITEGYCDPEIVGNVSGDLVELKAIIEALDYGLEFPIPK
jgi:integrase